MYYLFSNTHLGNVSRERNYFIITILGARIFGEIARVLEMLNKK